jgi:hypothetical protein
MVDAVRVDLQVAFIGAKCKDSNNLADLNLNKQAGNSPPKARARRVLAKGGRGRSIDKDSLEEEEPMNAGGGNPADG